MTKSSMPARRSAAPMPSPPKPAPMITTRWRGRPGMRPPVTPGRRVRRITADRIPPGLVTPSPAAPPAGRGCRAGSPPGHRADDQVRLGAVGDRPGERGVGRLVRQVLLAGEEPDERPPRAAAMTPDRAAQHRVARLQRVE